MLNKQSHQNPKQLKALVPLILLSKYLGYSRPELKFTRLLSCANFSNMKVWICHKHRLLEMRRWWMDNRFSTLTRILKLFLCIIRHLQIRSNRLQIFLKVNVVKNFAIFTGKHLCQSFSLQVCHFFEKKLQRSCFSVNIARFLRKVFLQNTSDGCFWQIILIMLYHNFYYYFPIGDNRRNKLIIHYVNSADIFRKSIAYCLYSLLNDLPTSSKHFPILY